MMLKLSKLLNPQSCMFVLVETADPFSFPRTLEDIKASFGTCVQSLLQDHYSFQMQFGIKPDNNKHVGVAVHRDLVNPASMSDDPPTTFAAAFQ
jgi:hypothetical protein